MWDKFIVNKDNKGLGFHDIHKFNIVVLGKQGWRLISNPYALVSGIYKLNTTREDLLRACLGHNPSYP
uniref:Uncharacterized protein n=1 Tax=Cajanus cajan TaxID=3821 RepID=A0A151TED5_CAJCA|nr:hypothetical protein KK1_011655 [Cajanus cajan]